MRSAILLGALVLGSHVAHADGGVTEPAPSAIAPPAPVDVPAPEVVPAMPAMPDRRTDAAWELYHRAFTALEDHDRDAAKLLLARLVREHPGHPATAAAKRVAQILDVPADGELARQLPAELADTPSANARAELATVQTIHGAVLGVELCAIGGCSGSDAAPFGLALIGASIGALATLSGFDAIRPSTRSLVDSGTVFGFMEGLFGSFAANADVSPTALLVGQLGGLGIGAALTELHPTAGQVALASSGGMWTSFVGMLAYAALDPQGNEATTGLVGLVSLNVGLLGGALLAANRPTILRGQTLVIDAAALVSGLAGGAIATFITNDASAPLVFGAASLGATVGLVTAALLTPELHGAARTAPPVQTFVIPAEHGRGALAGIGFRW